MGQDQYRMNGKYILRNINLNMNYRKCVFNLYAISTRVLK